VFYLDPFTYQQATRFEAADTDSVELLYRLQVPFRPLFQRTTFYQRPGQIAAENITYVTPKKPGR
jgi:hypothetical protein